MREQFSVCSEIPTCDVIYLCAGYFLINLVVSLTVNIAYVYVVVWKPATFDVLISLYKLFWNGVCAPRLSRYMLKRLHMTSADLFSLELYVSLMNNVIVPILATVFIHPRCFYSIFIPNIRLSSSFNNVWTYYVFPFRYSYQCSFEYMKYYSAAFIYLAIFTTFGIPAYELSLLFLYNRATLGTSWYWCIDYLVPRILKPLPVDAVCVSDICNPIFDGTRFLVAQLTCLALILSLGVVSPLFAGCLALCMIGTCAYTILKVGRYLHRAHKTPYAKHYVDSIEADSRGLVNSIMLRKSFWLLFFLSCWFMTPFLFDTLGSKDGFRASFWVLIAIPLFPGLIFLLYRTTRNQVVWTSCCAKVCGEGQESAVTIEATEDGDIMDDKQMNDTGSITGIELHTVVHNSLFGDVDLAEECGNITRV